MQKDVFWKAFILTIIVFIAGIYTGYILDMNRQSFVQEEYEEFSLDLADLELQSRYYSYVVPSSSFCDAAISENIRIADEAFYAGIKIDEAELANKITPMLIKEKKKYVLSKLRFWFNNIELKKNCNADFHNLVYFYLQFPNPNIRAKQDVQREVLTNIKNKYDNKVMLIPLPIDLDISTINIIKEQYGIKSSPTILIDETILLEGLQSKEKIEFYIQ